MTSASKIIILYPRAYNRRGDESLHSVEGLTHDGRLVNIKLRVQGNVRMAEATPSISRFAKLDIRESKLSCLASDDNGPDHPAGILLFTDCEEDTNNRKTVASYISRWAQILRSGHHAGGYGAAGDLPFIGLGRLFIDKETRKIKDAKESIQFLKSTQPMEWEDAVRRNEEVINDHKSYDFYLYGYLYDQERFFAHNEDCALVEFMNEKLGEHENTPEIGFMLRIELSSGAVVQEIYNEIFPIYHKVYMRYQHGAEMLEHFQNLNPDLEGIGEFKYRVMPILRFAGKKVFKDGIRSVSDFAKLEETYFIASEPRLFPMAVKIDRLENKERLLNKIHLLGPSIGSPLTLGNTGEASLGVQDVSDAVLDTSSGIVMCGISIDANPGFASWYTPIPLAAMKGHAFAALSDDEDGSNDNETCDQALIALQEDDNQAAESVELEITERNYVLTDSIYDTCQDGSAEDSRHTETMMIDSVDSALDESNILNKDTAHDAGPEPAVAEKGSEEPMLADHSPMDAEDDIESLFDEADDPVETTEDLEEDDVETVFGRASGITLDNIKVDPLMQDVIVASNRVHGGEVPPFPSSGGVGIDCAEEALANNVASDLSPWLDDEELEAKLDESPDAYSEETEGDQPTTEDNFKEADNCLVESRDLTPSAPKIIASEPKAKDEKPPRKGGLAGFIKKRGLL